MNWVKVNDELPEPEQKVIAFFINQCGMKRIIMAFFAPRFTVQGFTDDDDDEVVEYEEKTDEYYLKEGWYEMNEFEDIHYFVDGNITHWMLLPEIPEVEGNEK